MSAGRGRAYVVAGYQIYLVTCVQNLGGLREPCADELKRGCHAVCTLAASSSAQGQARYPSHVCDRRIEAVRATQILDVYCPVSIPLRDLQQMTMTRLSTSAVL
jgi:hypothetical protein